MWGHGQFCEREKEYYNILLSILLGGYSLHAGFILIDQRFVPERMNNLSIILSMDITSSYYFSTSTSLIQFYRFTHKYIKIS